MATAEATEVRELAAHKEPHKNHTLDAVIDFVGGVAGGTASVYVGQPLDTVKVKLQTFPTLYKNAVQCFFKTLRTDGLVRGLYAGTTPSLWAQISENAVLFMAYGMCQKGVMMVSGQQNINDLTVLQKASAGGCAAFFSSLTLCPTELIKCKMQALAETRGSAGKAGSAHLQRIGPWSMTKQILREEGFRGLFRGLVPTFAREMPGYFFFFGGYEATRHMLTPAGKTKEDLGLLRTSIAGGMGGVTLWVLVFPTDVIKSRIQVLGAQHGVITMFFKILRQEGFLALYKGLGPTLLRTFPATGALFLAYENTTSFLNNTFNS